MIESFEGRWGEGTVGGFDGEMARRRDGEGESARRDEVAFDSCAGRVTVLASRKRNHRNSQIAGKYTAPVIKIIDLYIGTL